MSKNPLWDKFDDLQKEIKFVYSECHELSGDLIKHAHVLTRLIRRYVDKIQVIYDNLPLVGMDKKVKDRLFGIIDKIDNNLKRYNKNSHHTYIKNLQDLSHKAVHDFVLLTGNRTVFDNPDIQPLLHKVHECFQALDKDTHEIILTAEYEEIFQKIEKD